VLITTGHREIHSLTYFTRSTQLRRESRFGVTSVPSAFIVAVGVLTIITSLLCAIPNLLADSAVPTLLESISPRVCFTAALKSMIRLQVHGVAPAVL